MSTRVTLAHGERFHLYQEVLEEDRTVYLQVSHCDACKGETTVAIPADVWEAIRKVRVSSFDLADLTDEELLLEAAAKVDERLSEARKATSTRAKAFALLFLPAGEGATREEHIAASVAKLTAERDRQCGILHRAAQHKVVGS